MNAKKLATALGGLAVLGLTIAGCGSEAAPAGSSGSASSGSASSEAAQGGQNDADVRFVQDMVLHHRQAVEMAGQAPGRTENAEILDLAARIGSGQEPQIDTMTGWLQSWGAEVPEGTAMSGMEGMPGMEGMSGSDAGMMSAEQMQGLEQAQGAAFDAMFLELMLVHHRGAVESATTELSDGADPEVRELAQTILDTQQGEITEMEALR